MYLKENHSSWRGGRVLSKDGVWIYIEKKKYALEHILIAERILGKPLPSKAVVHHVNKNKLDNRNCNLVICESAGYHQTIHRRERAVKACGHGAWQKCRYCGEYDNPLNMTKSPASRNAFRYYHKSCSAKDSRKRYKKKMLAEVSDA